MENLSSAELSRYSRHILLPEFGLSGQQKLKAAKVLLIGAGGLGSPIGLYLSAAGVGTLGIVDGDRVEDSNLQRQIIYTIDDIAEHKAECAARRLRQLNPYIKVQAFPFTLTATNALDLIRDYDLVVDGSDNFATRYLVNDACVLLGKPIVYGSIYRFEGLASVFNYQGGPCYRCLFPEPPGPEAAPSCAEAGVLGVLPGLIAGIQATEAIKIITDIGESLSGKLLQYDALAMDFQTLKIPKNPACPLCGETPSIHELNDQQWSCAPEEPQATGKQLSPEALKDRLDKREPLVLIDVREPYEREICVIGGSLPIPLQSLPEQLEQFDREQALVCYCKSGARSSQACQLLRERGFTNVANLSGGILAWADKIEPSLQRY